MFPKVFILAALFGAVTAFECGTVTTSEINTAASELQSQELAGNNSASANANFNIRTFVHIVSTSSSQADGNVNNNQVNRQIQFMNDRYAPQGIQFTLAGITRTVNANWANNANDLAMKRALRRGNYETLNLYVQTSLGPYAGYCYYPSTQQVPPDSDVYKLDGCNVLANSLPGPQPQFATGMVAVHEVGHWFGLMHTFEGDSCSGPGDNVADTAQQASASSGCPNGRDSCPGQPGVDPIHNYMDYSSDDCKTRFSNGQTTRMKNIFASYRSGK